MQFNDIRTTKLWFYFPYSIYAGSFIKPKFEFSAVSPETINLSTGLEINQTDSL